MKDFDLICKDFDSGSVYVYPIADVHLGALEHQKKEWEAFTAAVARKKNAYVILAGDLINNNTRSSVGSPWDDTLRPREQKKLMVEMLTPIRDRILCCVSGNHERRSAKDADDDPTYDIMAKLDLEDVYRTNAAFLRIRVGARTDNTKRTDCYLNSYTFAVTHGAGGGIYTGATVNRNERWGNVIDGADCVIVGHTHKGTVTRPSKIVIDAAHGQVSVKDYLVVSCVSWQAYGSYAMQKMLLPTATARPQVLKLQERPPKHIEVTW